MDRLINQFRSDLGRFRRVSAQFYNKEISMKEYKGFSGGFGSYAQRGGEYGMLRLRLPGGRLTKEKLKFVSQMIQDYDIKTAHFTTCQTIQLHNLKPEVICDIMEKALDVGIITMGGGGDFPRNAMVSPLSGVERGEYFDVLPYAEVVYDYLLTCIKTVKLPRKLKVGFSNSPKNVTHATFRDLGFVARKDGHFDVYSAGGLGNNPKMGVLIMEDISPIELIYYVRAMIETFTTYGNYEQRGKARTRYMQDTLGVDGYRKAFLEKLDLVKRQNHPEFAFYLNRLEEIYQNQIVSQEETDCFAKDNKANARLIPQKQEGLYSVVYHAIGGLPPVEKFSAIYEAIKDMEKAEVRIAPDETIYIINVPENQCENLLKITVDSAANLLETSVSCIGNTICQVGLRNSQGLLRSILGAVKEHHFADGVLPRIHISGCPSSCGTHQIGTLGFHGSSKRIDGKTESGFTFHVNGCETEGQERFGEQWGFMKEKEIPEFFVELGKTITAQDTTFQEWFEKNPEELRSIAKQYLY